MFKNYIKVTVRHLLRRKGLAVVNVLGLSVGIAACLLIFLYVRNELAVNSVFSHVDNLFRIDSDWRDPSMGASVTTLAPVGLTLVQEFPEVLDQVRIYSMFSSTRVGTDSYREDVIVADSSLFRLFNLPLLYGDPATALNKPRSVVITQELAETYFGTTDVLDRTIELETWNRGWQLFTITGIIGTLPYNSLLDSFSENRNDVIIPPAPYGDYFGEDGWTSWQSRYILQYVLLSPEASFGRLEEKLEGFIEKYAPQEYHDILNIRLNPVSTIYLTDNGNRGWRFVRLLSVVGLLILLLACINFTNLATAHSFYRIREIGVRKVVGAGRSQLALQFLGESMMISLFAALVGLLLTAICVRPFLGLFEKEFVLESYFDGYTFACTVVLALLAGTIAGIYPAVSLSSYRPARALKGVIRFGASALWLRRSLIVTQFAASIVLIVSVVTISSQLSFVADSELGFRTDDILVINSVPREWTQQGVEKAKSARDRLEQMVPGIQSVSLSWGTAADGAGNTRALLPAGGDPSQSISSPSSIVDESFLDTYEMNIVAGRSFSKEHPNDLNGIVLNEQAVKALGWSPEDAVGRSVFSWFQAQAGDDSLAARPIIGVVANHHFESLHQPIRPLAYYSVDAEQMYRILSIRLQTTDLAGITARIRKAWTEIFPTSPFEYSFLDDLLDDAYQAEKQIQQMIRVAALLAIFIAGMGILGLTSLKVVQRTKEIGVRKVLGASITSIIFLLMREVVLLVFIAMAVATPVAFLYMQDWLGTFTYRIPISWEPFLIAGLFSLSIACLTVFYHSVRAALTDPAKSLRYE